MQHPPQVRHKRTLQSMASSQLPPSILWGPFVPTLPHPSLEAMKRFNYSKDNGGQGQWGWRRTFVSDTVPITGYMDYVVLVPLVFCAVVCDECFRLHAPRH